MLHKVFFATCVEILLPDVTVFGAISLQSTLLAEVFLILSLLFPSLSMAVFIATVLSQWEKPLP